MQTVNISLPEMLTSRIDQIIKMEGYASRSEFIRALIRFYLFSQRKPEITLMPFRKISLKTVAQEMRKTGHYKEKFIKSVVKGLSHSSVYAQGKTATQ